MDPVGQNHDALKRAEEVLKIRVLDNLDALASKPGPIDPATLDLMVKKPIMAVTGIIERVRLSMSNPRKS